MTHPLRARAGVLLALSATVAALLTVAPATAGGRPASVDPAAGLPTVLRSTPVPGLDTYRTGDYLVTLADRPVARYAGGTRGLRATQPRRGAQLDARSAPARAYRSHLDARIDAVAAAVGTTPTSRYTDALSGFAAHLTAEQARALAARPDVRAVTLSARHHVDAVPDYEFMGLDRPGDGPDDGLWAALGGVDRAGAGIVVGDIDSGIAPENPSFAGDPLGTAAGGPEPWRSEDGTTTYFRRSDGGTFTGTCGKNLPTQHWSTSACSTKIISARYYVSGFGRGAIGTPATGEYGSPRDGSGHGSHTASTAAGESVDDAVVGSRHLGRISGVAPAAKIAVYKACWSGPDPTSSEDDGCDDQDLVAAIDQAVADGVDVLNFSIGAPVGAFTVFSPIDEAMLGAAAAGVFVAVSAGNEGSGASTADHGAPWYTTVAASTIPTYEATATLGDGSRVTGASITVPSGGVEAPLVLGDDVGATGVSAADAALCGPGTLDPDAVAGRVVVCTRGVQARVDKSKEVARAGGVGMLLLNPSEDSLDLDLHTVPTIAVDAPHYAAVRAYAATPGATVTLADGNLAGDSPPAPQVAGFSSRGPVEADGADVLKPDVTAPGVGILADGPNAAGAAPTFEFMSGTSMAAPHVTGLAALYLGVHPLAAPAEIKSAMMTTAYPTVTAQGPLDDVFAEGAGQVDPTRYLHPGMLFLSGPTDWSAYLHGLGYVAGGASLDGTQLNQASIADGEMTGVETITRTVTSEAAGTYRARPADLPGFSVAVTPAVLTFDSAGQTQSFTVTVTRTDAALGRFGQGSLDWVRDGDGQRVHLPLAFRPVDAVGGPAIRTTGAAGTVEVPFTNGVEGQPAVALEGLARASHLPNDGTAVDPTHSAGTTSRTRPIEVDREVPAGLSALRFSLHAVEPGATFGLYLYRVTRGGDHVITQVHAAWGSEEPGPDQSIVVVDPEPGSYILLGVPTGDTAGDVDLDEASLVSGHGPAQATLVRPGRTGTPGAANAATVRWAGLAPRSGYLGLVRIGSHATPLEVTTGAGPTSALRPATRPRVTGRARPGATLTATPGTWSAPVTSVRYQWLVGRVAVPGATGATFVVPRSARGRAVSVRVTASADGYAPGTAQSAPALVGRQRSRVALAVRPLRHGVRVVVTVASSVTPTGRVVVSVRGTHRTVRLAHGRATVVLRGVPAGRATVRATYAGSPHVLPARAARAVRVRG